MYKLSEFLASFLLFVTIFTAVLSNCPHFTAKYTQRTYFTPIYLQQVQFMEKVRFDGAYGVCVVRVANDLNSGIYCSTNKFRSLCFSCFY